MYIDIHSHVIPYVDDGAKDIEIALQMLKIAADHGTAHIIATPHYISGNIENTSSLVLENCNNLEQLVYEKGLDIIIHPGCEVFISPDIVELYEKKVICTLNNSSYMLIELPMMSIPPYINSVLYDLQLRGIIPVIAHPERNSEIRENPDILKDLVKRGVLAQVNAGSITGIYGNGVKKTVIKLMKMGLAHFVASDAHTNRERSPDLSKAAAIVEKVFGIDTMHDMFINNGMKLLSNERISSCLSQGETTKSTLLKVIINKIASIF